MVGMVPLTMNGITYSEQHHALMRHSFRYPDEASKMPGQYWCYADGYQRLVTFADIQPGESVLDAACGVGLLGLLVCDVVGRAGVKDVVFADTNKEMLRTAKDEVRRRFGEPPKRNFLAISDIRDPDACRQLLASAGKSNGFDVILAGFFLNHFTEATQPAMVAVLRTMLAPNGRLILHYGVLSPSSPYSGNPSDEMILGPRVILPQQDYGELKD